MLRKILLVDDDEDDRELFKEALQDVAPGVRLMLSENATDALQMLQDTIEELPDLLFLDINLPVTSGWECLVSIKNTNGLKDIPVIMYSTSSRPREAFIADEFGALCFITKPKSYSLLKNILSAALHCINNNQPQLIRQQIISYQ